MNYRDCGGIGQVRGAVQKNRRYWPLAIFTFSENAGGLDFLRAAKKPSW